MSFSSFIRRDSAESVRSVIHNSDLHANLLGDDETDDEEPLKPFCRWVSTLRRRKKHQSTPSVTPRSERWMLDGFDDITANTPLESRPLHAKSGSLSSSIQFVAGIKSATVTLASASIAPLSRRASKWRRTHNRSSILSGSDPNSIPQLPQLPQNPQHPQTSQSSLHPKKQALLIYLLYVLDCWQSSIALLYTRYHLSIQ